jgi:hypothetical protein
MTSVTLPIGIGCRAALTTDEFLDTGVAVEFYVSHTYIWTYADRYEPEEFQLAVARLVQETPRVHACAYPPGYVDPKRERYENANG